MSRIDSLIGELCPDGVPHKRLGAMGTFVRGNGLQKKDLTNSGVPAIHYGQVHTHYRIWTTQTIAFVTPEFAKRLRTAQPGDLIIATTSEDDAAVGKAVAWLGNEGAAVSGDAYIYRHSLDPKYVAYFFQSEQFQDQKKRGITGTKVRRISGEGLAKIRIPVPPIEVQREIARILDLFTTLEARGVQYAHYRDSLLAFRDVSRIRWTPMGELGQFHRGRRFTKRDVVEDGIPAIHYGEIYTRYGAVTRSVATHLQPELASGLRYAKHGDVVIVDVGETVEDVGKAVAWLGEGDIAIHDHSFAFRHSENPAYLSYYLQTATFQRDKAKYVARTKVKTLSMPGIAKIPIPVPPLEEQERIVAILDKFNALVNDLSFGLPAELAARRKQYEHYRDKLLTFKVMVA